MKKKSYRIDLTTVLYHLKGKIIFEDIMFIPVASSAIHRSLRTVLLFLPAKNQNYRYFHLYIIIVKIPGIIQYEGTYYFLFVCN